MLVQGMCETLCFHTESNFFIMEHYGGRERIFTQFLFIMRKISKFSGL